MADCTGLKTENLWVNMCGQVNAIRSADESQRLVPFVIGAALTDYNRRKDRSSFRDWASEAFEEALALSGVDRSDINLLVVSSESDFFTLQLNPVSVLASDLGIAGASLCRVEGGGASGQLAIQAGAQAIMSGQAKLVAVVGVDPSASQLPGDMIRELYGLSFDMWADGMTGASATVLYALSMQAFMRDCDVRERHLSLVAMQNRRNALANRKAHLGRQHSQEEFRESPVIARPYRRLHCSPLSDGAAAVILAAAEARPGCRKTAPFIAGMGAASDDVHLGARPDPGRFRAKETAMTRALAMASLSAGDIGLAEIYDAYSGAQLQALTALGLTVDVTSDLESGAFSPDGRLPVNLSGGLLGQGAPVGATGVGQAATCALLLEGLHYSKLQPPAPPAYALADTHGGVCTLSAVTILGQPDQRRCSTV